MCMSPLPDDVVLFWTSPASCVGLTGDSVAVRQGGARLAAYHRCDAQLEILNGFDSGLFVHSTR